MHTWLHCSTLKRSHTHAHCHSVTPSSTTHTQGGHARTCTVTVTRSRVARTHTVRQPPLSRAGRPGAVASEPDPPPPPPPPQCGNHALAGHDNGSAGKKCTKARGVRGLRKPTLWRRAGTGAAVAGPGAASRSPPRAAAPSTGLWLQRHLDKARPRAAHNPSPPLPSPSPHSSIKGGACCLKAPVAFVSHAWPQALSTTTTTFPSLSQSHVLHLL